LLSALDLKCAAAVDGGLHLGLLAFVFLEQAVSLVLGLSYLAVENGLSIVLEGLELCDLVVNHLLSLVLLLLEFLLFLFFPHVLEFHALLVVLFDLLGLCDVP
jgi:hypothetical protein